MILSVTNGGGLVKIMNLLVILKLQWIDKFFNKYYEITTLQRRLYPNIFLKFFNILLKALLFAHVFACIFLALAFHIDV